MDTDCELSVPANGVGATIGDINRYPKSRTLGLRQHSDLEVQRGLTGIQRRLFEVQIAQQQ
jgi:hypothetical protein